MNVRAQIPLHITLLLTALALGPVAGCGGIPRSASTEMSGPSDQVEAGSTETNGPSEQVEAGVTFREHPCLDPKPIGQTGYVECSAGFQHRAFKADCPYLPSKGLEDPTCDEESCYCQVGSDLACTERPYGYCSGPFALSVCSYGCVNDEGCAPDYICDCAPGHGVCVHAACKLDSDCGARLCTKVRGEFSCQTSTDECAADADCVGRGPGNYFCGFGDAGKVCVEASGVSN